MTGIDQPHYPTQTLPKGEGFKNFSSEVLPFGEDLGGVVDLGGAYA